MYARGTIIGITRGTKKAHIIRAALESIAFQSKDLVDCMQSDTGLTLTELNVDGGASENNFLMKFQSDILGIPILRSEVKEITSLGIMQLACLAIGIVGSKEELKARKREITVIKPTMEETKKQDLLKGWKKAVERSRNWEEH